MQNYFDDKAQQEKTSKNGNRGDDLWRNELSKKRYKVDKARWRERCLAEKLFCLLG